jgi:hypothetical protein
LYGVAFFTPVEGTYDLVPHDSRRFSYSVSRTGLLVKSTSSNLFGVAGANLLPSGVLDVEGRVDPRDPSPNPPDDCRRRVWLLDLETDSRMFDEAVG